MQITEADYVFLDRHWSGVSHEGIDIVKRLLAKNPNNRLSAKEALVHPWIKNDEDGVVAKAVSLMDKQRGSRVMSTLNGILSPEMEKGIEPTIVPSSLTKNGKPGKDNPEPPASKRQKVN